MLLKTFLQIHGQCQQSLEHSPPQPMWRKYWAFENIEVGCVRLSVHICKGIAYISDLYLHTEEAHFGFEKIARNSTVHTA